MSAKWRALQHRHRYTYSAVIFPNSYTDSLSQSPLLLNPKSLPFFNELNHLISLASVYSQVTHAKNLASSFTRLISSTKGDDLLVLETASRFYTWILFLENSLPLHRTLVSALAKVNDRELQCLVVKCFRELCEEYGGNKVESNMGKQRFCLSRVVLSVMGMPKLGYLGDVVQDCAVFVVWDAVHGLESVVSETKEWARPSPIVMEQCQEAMSCLYYLFQRFPLRLKGSNDFDAGEVNVMERVLGALISVLKSMAFSRDCFVAAGVSFCAALQVCLGTEELGMFIIEAIFYQTTCNFNAPSKFILEIPYKGDLCSEIRSLAALSRLCLIRGILTAVSRAVLNSPFVVRKDKMSGDDGNEIIGSSIKTILYDAILPELCNYCETPIDSHFNFHALTVLQICLQQMKTSMLSNLSDSFDNYEPFPVEMGSRVLRIIWNNMEDPLSQTVKQVHLIFDLFLDIQSTIHWGKDTVRIKSFLQKIALDLLHLGPRCKGRYVPLASLTKRLGAKTLLGMSPGLLYQTTQAYSDDDVCCAATTFLKCVLENLRDDYWNSNGVERGYTIYREQCLPPFLYGLSSGISKLRTNLNTYAVPVILELDVDSIFPMLSFISVGPNGEYGLPNLELNGANMDLRVEQQVAVLVSLLKVCRSLALIEGDVELCDTVETCHSDDGEPTERVNLYANVCIKGIRVKVLVEWLAMALTHVDESLRVDAAESLFLNPKTASLPSHLELTLLKEAVPLNMRSCSAGFQMKWTSLFRKFFSRVRTALERQVKLGSWQPLVNCDNNEVCSSLQGEQAIVRRAKNLFNFMRWLCNFLFFSCYPSAPYKRKIMAMELILIILNVWSIVPSSQEIGSVTHDSYLYPYSRGITSPESTILLVGSIIDSWDRLRDSSFRILLHFPNPLPGISSRDMIQRLIAWAKKLVCSPRVRESDAGALTLRLMFRKYVLELGWTVRSSVNAAFFPSLYEPFDQETQFNKPCAPVIEYIGALVDWLKNAVEEGEKDLLEACKNSFVHGILLALRYTFEELNWDSDVAASSISDMRCVLTRLLELVMRITSLALWVVSADAWYLPDLDEMDDDKNYVTDVDVITPSGSEGSTLKHAQDIRSSEQIVMVGCWLAMKEVSLLLGTIVRKIPLPSNSSDSSEPEVSFDDATDASKSTTSNAILDLKQLEQIGDHFLNVLLKMKHNGAIDKTRAGFTALCNRLLCSNDPRLCKLAESWMEQLMERTVAKGQTVDDLLRRSAGIPAAFIALFLSEPAGAPKKLLPRALQWLINVANSSLDTSFDVNGTTVDSCHSSTTNTGPEPDSAKSFDLNKLEKNSKIRVEGVVPTVHAFNVLRISFDDTNLATDTSGFAAEALIVSIRSFSSPYWEVRNSATLAYSALVRRTMGFLNVQKRESARRVLTGLEFFHRYPPLHPFLQSELKTATDLLLDATSQHAESNLAKLVHPSLCPILILLSRLKPSTMASESGDDLDPFLFMPFIRRCSTQSNLRIRILASRALTGLVSNEKLPIVLLNIASELPRSENQITADETDRVSYNAIHGMLLQLCILLDVNCRNLADFATKEKILSDMVQILAARSWIASPRQCPCPILNASFIELLDIMLNIARRSQIHKDLCSILDMLLELSTKCLDIKASCALPFSDPAITELRKQAAISYFSCVLRASEEDEEKVLHMAQPSSPSNLNNYEPSVKNFSAGLPERLIHSLSDPSYEVRLATLKWLLKSLNFIESNSDTEVMTIQYWTKSHLQPTMMKLLDSEKYHRCSYYILRILFAWNLLQFQKLGKGNCVDTKFVGNLDYDSVTQFWDKLIYLYKFTRHAKTQETLVCCIAICVKQFATLLTNNILATAPSAVDQLERVGHFYECITFFVNLIKEHTSSSEPVNMRKAAAESIIASGLLGQAEFIGSYLFCHEIPSKISISSYELKGGGVYAHQVLEMWFSCIKLLEDEDDAIRQSLAMDIQKCISFKGSANIPHAVGVPTQVEKVIELSFVHLSSTFGHWINYFDYLTQWVQDAAKYVVAKGDFVRRVFDKEIDNHHEEKLLICQICCMHLEKLPILKLWLTEMPMRVDFRNYLYDWRMRFYHQLTSFAKDHVEQLGEVDWIGGVGNHKDAFLPLYVNLLGFYALSNCMFFGEFEDGMLLRCHVIELGKAINPFFRNPLISNLYLLVVKAHEEKVGAIAHHLDSKFIDDTMWDDFDPYFLLR
ncbi:hypothetical protein K2173_014186 [Erythroxylum novogranatense]|uniref:DUF2428 domain-containing protein n=1 Tax=Erythroxylum novogranatense TaxID=1862640 RepID=A0AAV8SE28_9ROSI|nr:hypothetical protein K2173_014186 [Erythroxylum novogranatense]